MGFSAYIAQWSHRLQSLAQGWSLKYLTNNSINQQIWVGIRRHMSVERKYDTEYYQVHIDLSRSRGSIKIFFRSGSYSTNDRICLYGSPWNSLTLFTADWEINGNCQDLELLMWLSGMASRKTISYISTVAAISNNYRLQTPYLSLIWIRYKR